MNADAWDRTLVLRAQSGDRGAFDALVRKYWHRVMKLAMRYTPNRADAEDVVQETFIKAYGALPRFRGESAFYSWLHRIAINSAMTALARHARQASGAVMDEPVQTLYELDTPENLALCDELCGAVDAAVDALPDEQRMAIWLREIQGLSYPQVGVAMSCPVGTVRSRIFRARHAINRHLRRMFDDGGRGAYAAGSETWRAVGCTEQITRELPISA